MRRGRSGLPVIVVGLLCAVALAAGIGAWRAAQAGPLPPTLQGPCELQAFVEPGDLELDAASSSGVFEIPPQATVTYRGSLAGGADPGRRRLEGRVRLDLPPLLPDVTIARWDEFGSLASADGSQRYSLSPRWAPTGLTVRVSAEHREATFACNGSMTVRLGGSAFGSWLRPLAVLLLVGAACLVARASLPRVSRHDPWLGRLTGTDRWDAAGRPGFGVVAGLLYGLLASVVLLLSSAIALHSVWVLLWPIFGMAVGLLLGWWGPIGRRDGEHASAPPPPEERDLAVLEPL